MGQYATPGDDTSQFLAELADLKRRIKDLETAAPLRNASISDGGQLVIKGVNGNTMVRLGRSDDPSLVAPDGHKQMVVQMFRDTGEGAFVIADPLPGVGGFHQFWALFDLQNNIVASDDATSGQGLARPSLPVPFYDYTGAPPVTTTSATFATLQRSGKFIKHHPRLQAQLLVASGASTTGEVRLWDATHGVQIGATVSLAAGVFTFVDIGPAAVTGAHMEQVDIDVQARRITGAGTIGAQVFGAYGVQS